MKPVALRIQDAQALGFLFEGKDLRPPTENERDSRFDETEFRADASVGDVIGRVELDVCDLN